MLDHSAIPATITTFSSQASIRKEEVLAEDQFGGELLGLGGETLVGPRGVDAIQADTGLTVIPEDLDGGLPLEGGVIRPIHLTQTTLANLL